MYEHSLGFGVEGRYERQRARLGMDDDEMVMTLNTFMTARFVISFDAMTRRQVRERGSRSGSRAAFRRLGSSVASEVGLDASY